MASGPQAAAGRRRRPPPPPARRGGGARAGRAGALMRINGGAGAGAAFPTHRPNAVPGALLTTQWRRASQGHPPPWRRPPALQSAAQSRGGPPNPAPTLPPRSAIQAWRVEILGGGGLGGGGGWVGVGGAHTLGYLEVRVFRVGGPSATPASLLSRARHCWRGVSGCGRGTLALWRLRRCVPSPPTPAHRPSLPPHPPHLAPWSGLSRSLDSPPFFSRQLPTRCKISASRGLPSSYALPDHPAAALAATPRGSTPSGPRRVACRGVRWNNGEGPRWHNDGQG